LALSIAVRDTGDDNRITKRKNSVTAVTVALASMLALVVLLAHALASRRLEHSATTSKAR
jgi:redox-regulated HSP33 family molecular chaperone